MISCRGSTALQVQAAARTLSDMVMGCSWGRVQQLW